MRYPVGNHLRVVVPIDSAPGECVAAAGNLHAADHRRPAHVHVWLRAVGGELHQVAPQEAVVSAAVLPVLLGVILGVPGRVAHAGPNQGCVLRRQLELDVVAAEYQFLLHPHEGSRRTGFIIFNLPFGNLLTINEPSEIPCAGLADNRILAYVPDWNL